MRRRHNRNTKKVIVKIRISEVLLGPRIYDADARSREPIRKKCVELDGNFVWCCVRRPSDIYSDMVDTLGYARLIAHMLGSGFEFWTWSRKYLVFGLRAEAYQMLRASELIDHIGTVRLMPRGFIEDLFVLDPARVQAVGAFLKEIHFDPWALNRHLFAIVQNASTLAVGTRSDKTVWQTGSDIIADANRIWEMLEYEDDQEGWKNFYRSSALAERHSGSTEQRDTLPN